MEVYAKTVYTLEDKTFTSLRDVKGHVESRIGSLIDKHAHFRDRAKVLELILNNRKELTQLLNVSIHTEEHGYVNVLSPCIEGL